MRLEELAALKEGGDGHHLISWLCICGALKTSVFADGYSKS